jgi:hypothetical protein
MKIKTRVAIYARVSTKNKGDPQVRAKGPCRQDADICPFTRSFIGLLQAPA